MISAANHQQPLSGNRIFIWALIPVLLFSCSAFKKSTTTEWPEDEEIVVVNPGKGGKQNGDKNEEHPKKDGKDKEDTVYSTVVFKGDKYRVAEHKQKFDIAVLLPFHTDATNSSKDHRRSALMLEYYQGMKIAAEELKGLTSSFNLHFFDTDNDTNKIKTILKKPELEKMDLILGPTDEKQVRMAAYFARKHKIPLFSPISVVSDLWSNNPYLYNLHSSPRMQALQFLKYFKQYHQGEKLLIVRDSKHYDKTFGAALVKECQDQKINFAKIAFSKYTKWTNHLGADRTVVVNTSTNESDLEYVVTGLVSMSDKVTLIGSDKWMDFKDSDYKHFEKLNISFLSTNKAQVTNDMARKVQQKYRQEYKDDPSWYTYMGYDQLMFSCEVLDAFGEYFPLFLENKTINYANSDFTLVKSKYCFNSRYLEIFRYENSELKVIDVK